MTDILWGDSIPVDGKRPDWLRDDDKIGTVAPDGEWQQTRTRTALPHWITWAHVDGFRLPVDHPYYTVQRHNAQNGTNFNYWPGGENAPDEWDGGFILLRSGYIGVGEYWGRNDAACAKDIQLIGYTRGADPLPAATPVREWSLTRVRELTAFDAIEYAFARYIEQHEQPPVDPDVLAVREILAAWYNDTFIGTAKRVEDGDYDSSDWFLKALAAYRKHRQ